VRGPSISAAGPTWWPSSPATYDTPGNPTSSHVRVPVFVSSSGRNTDPAPASPAPSDPRSSAVVQRGTPPEGAGDAAGGAGAGVGAAALGCWVAGAAVVTGGGATVGDEHPASTAAASAVSTTRARIPFDIPDPRSSVADHNDDAAGAHRVASADQPIGLTLTQGQGGVLPA
jgi:hypothetical protein